MEIGDLVHI